MVLTRSQPWCGRVRGEDRREVTVSEAIEGRRVTERPVNPLGPVETGELNGVSHLCFDPCGPRRRGLD